MFFQKIIGKKILLIGLCCVLNTTSSFGYNGTEAFLEAIISGNADKIRNCLDDHKEVKNNKQLLALGLYVICSKIEEPYSATRALVPLVSATTKLQLEWLKFAYEQMLDVTKEEMDWAKNTPLAAAAGSKKCKDIFEVLVSQEAFETKGKCEEKYISFLKDETRYKTPVMTKYIIEKFKLNPNAYAPEPVKNLKKDVVGN